jgi:drug/metabolite transporter (DMT)-like permease
VGFVGIVVLVWPQLTVGGEQGVWFLYGVAALQVATLGWALGTAYTKRVALDASPLGASAVQMLLSGVMLIAIGTAAGEWPRLTFNGRTAVAMTYLVLIGSIVGYTSYVYALRHLPITTVSLYAYVNPVIAVVLGTVVLDEPFNLRIVAASALVLVGVAVVRTGGGAASATRPAAGLRWWKSLYRTRGRDACATR